MKRSLSLVGLCILLSIPLSGASALSMAAKPNSLGSACAKVGAKATIGSNSTICTKVGKKLIWQKSKVLVPKVSTAPTNSASPTSTPTPSKTATPTQSASTPALPTSQSEYEINVNAKTWSWSFAYFLAGAKEPRKGPTPTLFIPQGKTINLNLLSSDTSHGFWVPGLSLAKEVVAGATGSLKFTADNLGKFPGICNIECGRGHSGMTFSVEVISETDYLKFLTTLKAS